MTLHIKDLEGKVDAYRDGVHAFGTAHPFTFGTITLVIGAVLGVLFS